MPLSDRMRRRLSRHHLPLALGVGLAVPAMAWVLWSGPAVFRWSMATAYVAMALLTVTLSIGAWQLWRGGRAPLSSDLRRDIGIWTALVSLAHVAFGLQVHMSSLWLYFVNRNAQGSWRLRIDPFGLSNWAGLLATLVLLLLLALSNDASLRRLGRERWKWLQRWVYAAAVLVVLHGAVYQLLERRAWAWVGVFVVLVLLAVLGQSLGVLRRRALA